MKTEDGRKTLKDQFVETLEKKILSGEYPIGSRVPTERELALSFSISRVVVRSGIAELAGMGFLEIQPRQGAFVADFRKTGSVGALVSIMKNTGEILRPDEIKSIIEIRMAFEIVTIKNVIHNCSDEEIASLNPFVDNLKKAKTSNEVAEALYEFHHNLNLLSGNTLIPMFYASFKTTILGLWSRYCKKYGKEVLLHNTFSLLDNIKSRDEIKAIAWCNEYLNYSIKGEYEIYEG